MPGSDPTKAMRALAASLPTAVESLSCNQYAYKAGKKAFFYVGPGAKGVGFKAMFKLAASMTRAEALAAEQPKHFEVGKTGWVTARFTAEQPLAKTLWKKWITESYGLSSEKATKAPPAKKKAARKK